MKLFAIVDKDGVQITGAKHDEQSAWLQLHYFSDLVILWDAIKASKEKGYRCIELHTYDPSKQVVVDRDVYKHISQYVGDVLEEYGGDGFPFDGQLDAANKFLKAGEIKP